MARTASTYFAVQKGELVLMTSRGMVILSTFQIDGSNISSIALTRTYCGVAAAAALISMRSGGLAWSLRDKVGLGGGDTPHPEGDLKLDFLQPPDKPARARRKVVGRPTTLSGAVQVWRAPGQTYLPQNKVDEREARLIHGATSLSIAR